GAQRVEGGGSGAQAQGGKRGAVRQLEVLHQVLDVDQAAAPGLDVVAAGARLQLALLAPAQPGDLGAHLLGPRRRVRARRPLGPPPPPPPVPPPRARPPPADRATAAPHAPLDGPLPLPRRGLLLVVAREARQRRYQRALPPRRAEPRVDLVQPAGG